MSWATCAPPVTGSEPPSQKSFWTSTTISARFMGATVVGIRATQPPVTAVPRSVHNGGARRSRATTTHETPKKSVSEVDGVQDRLALAEHPGDQRQLLAGGEVAGPGRLERLAPDDLAAAHQRHQQRAVVPVVLGRLADADHLGLGHPARAQPAQRELPAADGHLV